MNEICSSHCGTYSEILRGVFLDEANVAGVTGASALFISLVFVAGAFCQIRLSREASNRRERRSECDQRNEKDGNSDKHFHLLDLLSCFLARPTLITIQSALIDVVEVFQAFVTLCDV